MLSETLARLDSAVRPLMMHLPARTAISIYSSMRPRFLHRFTSEVPPTYTPPLTQAQTLWGINFRAPIFNAAGMFKNGEAYYTVASQGAGAYLAGTTTALARMGNEKKGIKHPFAPYPHSGAASNWLGLPNRSHATVATILSRLTKTDGCPIGASVSSDPTQNGIEALQGLVEGMNYYLQANVDFIELNESCPNVPAHGHEIRTDELDAGLLERLEYISTKFIKTQQKNIPVIVKFSNDTDSGLVHAIVEVLTTLGFSGVNFGNTSTQYARYRNAINQRDVAAFDYFTKTFGGGLSGAFLKASSLELAAKAVQCIPETTAQEFHVVRTGGVETAEDITASRTAGIALCQWYTGYFEQFARNGHGVYKHLFA